MGLPPKTPLNASVGGIFRDREGVCIGCFAQNLGNVNAYHAELVAAMLALEIAQRKGFNHLWLETDSQLVSLGFKSHALVPWSIRNRWENCISSSRNIHLTLSHVYKRR